MRQSQDMLPSKVGPRDFGAPLTCCAMSCAMQVENPLSNTLTTSDRLEQEQGSTNRLQWIDQSTPGSRRLVSDLKGVLGLADKKLFVHSIERNVV